MNASSSDGYWIGTYERNSLHLFRSETSEFAEIRSLRMAAGTHPKPRNGFMTCVLLDWTGLNSKLSSTHDWKWSSGGSLGLLLP